MRPVQYFSDEYLSQCRAMTPEQIIVFLDDFRRMHGKTRQPTPSRLISIKMPDDLLRAFRIKADLIGIRYQTQIKNLMREWITQSSSHRDK